MKVTCPLNVAAGSLVRLWGGRWVATLVARLFAAAALWVRIQTSLKNTKRATKAKEWPTKKRLWDEMIMRWDRHLENGLFLQQKETQRSVQSRVHDLRTLTNYIHRWKCIWIIDSDLLQLESFWGNFCVLRRSCASTPPPPPPLVCKWIQFPSAKIAN